MWLLYIFSISVIGVLAILASKINEIKNNRRTPIGLFLAKVDPVTLRVVRWLRALFHHHSERAFFLFLVHLPNRAETFSKHLKAKAHDYYHGANRRVRGKRDFPNGAASPYMRSMYFRRGTDGRV